MTLGRSIDLGAQRQTRARVRVHPGNDFNNSRAQAAAVGAMDDAQKLTGLAAGQLDDEQARLRHDRERRELQRARARACQCGDQIANAGRLYCVRCRGTILQPAGATLDLAQERAL